LGGTRFAHVQIVPNKQSSKMPINGRRMSCTLSTKASWGKVTGEIRQPVRGVLSEIRIFHQRSEQWLLRAALWEVEVNLLCNPGFHRLSVAGGTFKSPLTHRLQSCLIEIMVRGRSYDQVVGRAVGADNYS